MGIPAGEALLAGRLGASCPEHRRMKLPRHGRLGSPEAVLDPRFVVEEEDSDAPAIGPSNHHY